MNFTAQPPRITLDFLPTIAVIRFDRPAERNKLSTQMLGELEIAVSRVERDANVRAVVFTGTEDVFASGADISELQRLTPESAHAFARRGQNLFRRIARSSRLTIAAINGYCIGGGLDLALACHLRFAAPRATFAHPGARLGIITGWSGTQRLPRLIGQSRALEMFLTSRRLSSAEALNWGLVHRVCGDVYGEAVSEAGRRASAFV